MRGRELRFYAPKLAVHITRNVIEEGAANAPISSGSSEPIRIIVCIDFGLRALADLCK